MGDLRAKLSALYSLEQLSARDTPIHRLHPGAKLLVTAVYILCAASCNRFALGRLAPFLLYPAVLCALGEVPWGMLLTRSAAALPFCLFAGVSNLILDRRTAFFLGSFPVSAGLLSLAVLAARTVLCVSAVLLLTAVTPFPALMAELRRLRVPELLVSLLEMVWRYAGVLVEEAAGMVTAFRLRSGGAKWPDFRDFPALVGQLLLRSAARAERIYQAMECRLYGPGTARTTPRPWSRGDVLFALLGAGSALFFRAVDVSALLGGLLW